MSKVKFVKLVNNEILIGNVTENDNGIILDKPFQVGMVPTEEGEAVGFIDFNNQLGNANFFNIRYTSILYIWTPNPQIENSYITRSTGVELATAGELDLNNLTE